MKGSVVIFDTLAGRPAAARMVDGRLHDLLVDPPDDVIRPGTIYRARAKRQMKGQGGMVMETPDGPLFLRGVKGVSEGETLLVQVSSYAEDGKASPCSARLLFKSRFALVTPGAAGLNISKAIKDEEARVALREILAELDVPEDVGVVVRTAAADADEEAVFADIQSMLELARDVIGEGADGPVEKLLEGPGAEDLALRDWPAPDGTEDGEFEAAGVLDALDALRGREDVSGGGYFYVEPTRALVSVDVNTGNDTSPAAGLKATIESLRALPRVLRLRGLGGQIVIDCAPFPKKNRKQVESVIRAAFRTDGIETSFVGWTPLGHIELIRKRERLPLPELGL
ncbi:MAG: ribonuclease E/G [Pseudomonadota bacterium]